MALPGDEEPRARRAAAERAAAARGRQLDDIAPLEVVDAPFERIETIDAVWRAVEALNVDLKMALLLRDVVGLSYTEIADSLEITLATVKWRIYKAREEVQPALAREGVGGDTRPPARSARSPNNRARIGTTIRPWSGSASGGS